MIFSSRTLSFRYRTNGVFSAIDSTTREVEKTHNKTLVTEPKQNKSTVELESKIVWITNSNSTTADLPISDPIPYETIKQGTVTKIVDGDTIDIDGKRIRLSLVNTPEREEYGYESATDFTRKLCPVGTLIMYDEDDKQKKGSYGRMIAKVWCMGYPAEKPDASLNALLLNGGHAEIIKKFCDNSEYGNEPWAKRYGC